MTLIKKRLAVPDHKEYNVNVGKAVIIISSILIIIAACLFNHFK